MSDEPKSFNLNRPEGTAKDEYLYLWQTFRLNLSHLLSTGDLKYDPRVVNVVRDMIALIAHDNIRRKAEDQFQKALDFVNAEYGKDGRGLDLAEKNDNIMRVCMVMVGSITSYFDQFKGLAHQLKVGELVDMKKDYYTKSISGDATTVEELIDDMSTYLFPADYVEVTETELLICEVPNDAAAENNG